jgi:hypothetical protein
MHSLTAAWLLPRATRPELRSIPHEPTPFRRLVKEIPAPTMPSASVPVVDETNTTARRRSRSGRTLEPLVRTSCAPLTLPREHHIRNARPPVGQSGSGCRGSPRPGHHPSCFLHDTHKLGFAIRSALISVPSSPNNPDFGSPVIRFVPPLLYHSHPSKVTR